MPFTNFKNGVASFGVPVIGSGDSIPATTGSYFFVDSATGSDSNSGKSPKTPKATIDAAIGLCTAAKGDVIVVAAGHAETIAGAAAINCDVSGITIVGLGKGANRPIITSSATTDTVAVGAANVTLKNLLFQGGIDSQTIFLDINSTDCTVDSCEFREGSSIQILTSIDITGGAANACDRATIKGCIISSIAAGATNGIELGEVADQVTIRDCIIDGDFGNAGIHNPTGKVLTNLRLINNIVRNRQTGDHAIELVSACTGEAVGNRLFADTAGTILDPGSLFCSDNTATNAIDQSDFPVPETIADSAANLIGADDSDNGAATTNVAANEDGSVLERLEQLQEAVNKGTGTALASNKSLVDALGTDGTTVSDTAAGLAGMIGVNDSDNAFSSSSVVANVDGSVLERLEALMDPLAGYNPRLGFGVTKVSNLADGTGTDDLFTVTGRVLITSLTGEVTTVVGGAATLKIRDITNSVDLCAATTIDSDAVGTMYALTSISANILNGTGGTPVVGSIPNITGAQQVDVAIVGDAQAALTLSQVLDAADTGAITWRLTYIPLISGATVAAAA